MLYCYCPLFVDCCFVHYLFIFVGRSLFLYRFHHSFIVRCLFIFAVVPSCVAFAVVVIELLLPHPRLLFDCCVIVVVVVIPCHCPNHPHFCPSSSLSLVLVLILHPCPPFCLIVVSSTLALILLNIPCLPSLSSLLSLSLSASLVVTRRHPWPSSPPSCLFPIV